MFLNFSMQSKWNFAIGPIYSISLEKKGKKKKRIAKKKTPRNRKHKQLDLRQIKTNRATMIIHVNGLNSNI